MRLGTGSEPNKTALATKTATLSLWFCLFAVLTVLSLTYLFCVGVAEAARHNGRIPGWLGPCAEIYSRPAYFAADLPVLQVPARLAIEVGYRLADGPDMTR